MCHRPLDWDRFPCGTLVRIWSNFPSLTVAERLYVLRVADSWCVLLRGSDARVVIHSIL